MATMQKKYNSIIKLLNKLDVRMNSFEVSITKINSKIDEISSSIEKKIGKLEAKILAIEQNCDSKIKLLEETIQKEAEKVPKLKEEISLIKTSQNEVNTTSRKKHISEEAYSKRLNLLIHGLNEQNDGAWETSQQSEKIVRDFFKEGLQINDPAKIKLDDIHRLPRHPVYQSGIKKNRPIIIKLSNAFDKSLIKKSCSNLKKYNESRKADNPSCRYVYVSDHLTQEHQKQKKSLMPTFKKAREMNKKSFWKICDGEYCLFIDGRKISPDERNA